MHKTRKRGVFYLFISGISQKTVTVMNLFLLPLTVAFVYIGIEFLQAASVDILMAKDDFLPIFEYLMTSLIIVMGGSAILDLSLRELEEKSKK